MSRSTFLSRWSIRMPAMMPEKPAPTACVQEKDRQLLTQGRKHLPPASESGGKGLRDGLMATLSLRPLCPAGWSSTVKGTELAPLGKPVAGSRSMLILRSEGEVNG